MSRANPPLRVLFVCTENAGRSQIAEALLYHKGRGAFHVASAGPHPAVAKRHAFADAVLYLRQRIDFLLLIPIEKLERAALEQRIKAALEEQTADGAPG